MVKRFNHHGWMRAAIMMLAIVLTVSAFAQKPKYKYDSDHKYDLVSNLTIGVAGQYSFAAGGNTNVGASLLLTKRISDYWRLRYSAGVNGFKCDGVFDRRGTLMAGVNFDIFKWLYLFGDYGAVFNPSSAAKFGMAMDAGMGLQCNFGKYSILYTEAGVDRVETGGQFSSNTFVRLGYAIRPGITENDRQQIDIDRNVREDRARLLQENQQMQVQKKKDEELIAKYETALDRSTAAIEAMTKQLADCNTQVQEVQKNCENGGDVTFRIFFEYASAELNDIEAEKVYLLAREINSNNYTYQIEGYSSKDGDQYRNQKLSENRAYAVWNELILNGVSSERLVPVGNGICETYDHGESTLNRMVIVRQLKH